MARRVHARLDQMGSPGDVCAREHAIEEELVPNQVQRAIERGLAVFSAAVAHLEPLERVPRRWRGQQQRRCGNMPL